MIGFLAHRRHDEDDIITATAATSDVIGHLTDAVSICDGGATKLLNDKSHGQSR